MELYLYAFYAVLNLISKCLFLGRALQSLWPQRSPPSQTFSAKSTRSTNFSSLSSFQRTIFQVCTIHTWKVIPILRYILNDMVCICMCHDRYLPASRAETVSRSSVGLGQGIRVREWSPRRLPTQWTRTWRAGARGRVRIYIYIYIYIHCLFYMPMPTVSFPLHGIVVMYMQYICLCSECTYLLGTMYVDLIMLLYCYEYT